MFALGNSEGIVSDDTGGLNLDRVDPGGWGRLTREIVVECGERLGVTFRVNADTIRIIQHPSANAVRVCDTKDKRAESNALHDTTDPDRLGMTELLLHLQMRHGGETMQPRPCQPICSTRPSTTSTGIVR